MDNVHKPSPARHRAKLLPFIEQSRDPVWIAQLDGSLVYMNDAAVQLFGTSADALLGSRAWMGIIHPDDRADAWPSLPPEPQAHAELEYRIVTTDGQTRWLRDRRHRFHDPTDGTDYIGGVWEDVTAQREAQQELREARRRASRSQQLQRIDAQRRFASAISHSFGNMLTPIISFSELALGALPHGHPAASDMHQVIATSRQASELIHQLMAFSLKQHLNKRALDLNDLIRAIAPTLRGILGNSIRLQLELCYTPATIRADRAKIEQAIISLLTNARDAMPTGGRITLRTEVVMLREPDESSGLASGEHVRLTVQDTGIGIDPKIIDHIFEPFFTTQRPDKEAGLGLATTFGIVAQHKGAIFVESEVGKGSSFQLMFRLHDESLYEPSTSEISVAALNEISKPSKLTILVVEDDDVVRDLIARILRRHGYEVLTADGPEQALQLIGRTQDLDLLLTDVIMPEMNGPELVAKILSQRPGLRVLYASGHAVNDAMPDTPHAFLPKPFTTQSLVAKIREVLES